MKTSTTLSLAILLALSAALWLPDAAFAHSETTGGNVVGIDENLGGSVPLDVVFRDEAGAPISLRQLVHSPTILALVYYRCPNYCDYLLLGVAGSLRSLPSTPGTDFSVITLSIDEAETPVDARKAKRIALEAIEKPFPPSAWRFLTGDAAAIHRVAQAVGYHFVRRGTEFDHPVGIVVLSPQGRIVRYMNGSDFLPADLQLALLEASQGRIGPTIAKVLRFCFTTDPKSHQLVFNLLRIVGSVTLLAAAGLIGFIVFATRRRSRAGRSA